LNTHDNKYLKLFRFYLIIIIIIIIIVTLFIISFLSHVSSSNNYICIRFKKFRYR